MKIAASVALCLSCVRTMDVTSCTSHSGHLLFADKVPVVWCSKSQQTVETNTISSEFIALKSCIEDAVHLHFKLRMFGVPVPDNHATNIFCNNERVVKNLTNVDSTLNKKHLSITCHFARWCVVAGIVSLAWINVGDNLVDGLTKRLSETQRDCLFGNWMH